MIRSKVIYTFVVSLWLLALVGCAAETSAETAPTTDNITPIRIAKSNVGNVSREYVSIGAVAPINTVTIYAGNGGYIEEVPIETGQRVLEGDLLLKLDDSEADMTDYYALESQLRTVRDNLAAQIEDLQESYAKQETMLAEGIITQSELDQTTSSISALEREYANAKVAYTSQLRTLKNGLEDSVANRIITSPIDGIIAAVTVKAGQSATGQTAMTIIDDSNMYVHTYIGSDLKRVISVGDSVQIRTSENSIENGQGQVSEIQELPDPVTKLYEVKIKVNDEAVYMIGEYTEVTFTLESYDAVLIPTDALLLKGDASYVYTYDEGQVAYQEVETGLTKGTWIEAKNLPDGVVVVVQGQNQLTTTSVVEVVD